MSLTTQINNLKRKQVIMIYAGVVIVIGAIILYLVLQPSDTDKIKNTTPAAITQKTVSTTSYFSKLSIPSNLTVKENTQGNGTDFKTYSQTLTNSSGTFNIIITAIPTNIDKRQNTGLETFLVPDQSL